MGRGTLFISLPKEWAKRYRVQKGDLLEVVEREDGSLIIKPHLPSRGEGIETISLTYKGDIEEVSSEITGMYLLGYDTIRIDGIEEMEYGDRERVRRAVRRLVGLEILEEDQRSMTIQCILELATLRPDKLFKRMHIISSAMRRDAIASIIQGDERLAKVVVERDDEIDRLYFLLVRLLRSAVRNPSLADHFKMEPIEYLDYRVASSLVEAIGDSSVEIAENALALGDFKPPGSIVEALSKIDSSIESLQETVIASFLSKDIRTRGEISRLREEIEELGMDLSKNLLEQPPVIIVALSSLVASIHKICQCNIDINDLILAPR